ncbi:4-hydroxybenzoate octaprenyltransferase [Saccharophagus sp. K07]|uniref:4-hydroxybenzoate octaprenyltransferase n=1 Tax=Saccharophagus sp. K07 TaxID=2283636 RepID=UPI001651E15E|nr:4-hydroxybenzoate octaprenyltransferase [Saccharophagus sp. K07]MBC6904126.1 4-hydroxybenzoate octaprenyltransferase [Saccharophagus sp. K07]
MNTTWSILGHYVQLTRINRPIGIYLVLWPTLWSLWLAAKGAPDIKNLVIFILGCIFMRSAGCIINDFADRNFDGHVERTRNRPLATGAISNLEALSLFGFLCFLSFLLVLFTNGLTIKLAFAGLALALSYPFMKRYTHLPQVVLGAAFGWAIPMAFAAQSGSVPLETWLVFTAALIWTVVYDTFYAMVDRDDDIKIGIKSTAVLFGENDRIITGTLQVLALLALILVGKRFGLGWFYYLSLVGAAGLFAYQQYLIRNRNRDACFAAFLNNNWVGMVVFIGIVGHYALTPAAVNP